MISIKKFLGLGIATMAISFGVVMGAKPQPVAAAACVGDDFLGSSFLGIPAWYKYLQGEDVDQLDKSGSSSGTICQPKISANGGTYPKDDIFLIIAALLEALVRIAGLAAFIYLLYGGFMYLTSSGNSENVSKAGTTLLNAAIGLAIAISATTLINFFASRLNK